MAKKKTKNQDELVMKIIVAVLVIIILLVINSVLNLIKSGQTIDKEKSTTPAVVVTPETIQEEEDRTELELLKSMNERNRIEYYITKFINYVENGEYEQAYSLLNKEYKETYFPTESSFRDYASQTFSKMLDVEYVNFERNGNIYVSWLNIADSINGSPDEKKEFNFVVKENDFNDFELSFSKN